MAATWQQDSRVGGLKTDFKFTRDALPANRRQRVRWRSHPSGTGAPAWCSPDGDAIVSVQRFRDELVRFDHDVIAAMQARVDALATGRLRPTSRSTRRPCTVSRPTARPGSAARSPRARGTATKSELSCCLPPARGAARACEAATTPSTEDTMHLPPRRVWRRASLPFHVPKCLHAAWCNDTRRTARVEVATRASRMRGARVQRRSRPTATVTASRGSYDTVGVTCGMVPCTHASGGTDRANILKSRHLCTGWVVFCYRVAKHDPPKGRKFNCLA